MNSPEIKTVVAFMEAINQPNFTDMYNLMAEDHTFVDSEGTAQLGRNKIITGWKEFLRMFPDYRISVESILADKNLVAVFGSASGTYNGKRGLVPENRIVMPAAWKVIVENGKIKLWQVYADWTTGCKTMDEDKKAG